jgi:hypothetical protein
LYTDKDSEYHKIWWKIMRESSLHKKYKDYKLEHDGRSQPRVVIDVNTFPDHPKALRKFTILPIGILSSSLAI